MAVTTSSSHAAFPQRSLGICNDSYKKLIYKNRETDRKTERQTDRQTGRQADRQTETKTYGQTDRLEEPEIKALTIHKIIVPMHCGGGFPGGVCVPGISFPFSSTHQQ